MATVPEKQDYKLISGEFSADEARHLLMSLIDFKIGFHQQKNWSQRERFGTTDPAAQKRIAELEKTKENLYAIIRDLSENNGQLSINCDIRIDSATHASG